MGDHSAKKLGRRDAIKLILAGAGAITASSFIPEKWVKPVVEFGVSPVYAQASFTLPGDLGTLTGIVLECDGDLVPAVGATVTVVGTSPLRTAIVNSSGVYTIFLLAPGTYDVTSTVGAGDASGVVITAGATTVQDLGASGC